MDDDADRLLDRLERLVQQARPVPLSASCVVHRDEVLALLADLRRALPAQQALVERTAVHEAARVEAARLVAEAEQEAEALRRGADDDVDVESAQLEVALTRTLDAVRLGRARLHGESELDALSRDG